MMPTSIALALKEIFYSVLEAIWGVKAVISFYYFFIFCQSSPSLLPWETHSFTTQT